MTNLKGKLLPEEFDEIQDEIKNGKHPTQPTSNEEQSSKSPLQELESELADLKAELKVIDKYLLDKKKMNNALFKELNSDKAEIEKMITEVELDIELLKVESK